MKNTFLTILFLIVSLCLAAQIQKKTDSLFTLLKTVKADTILANTYNKLSLEYKRSNSDTALYFANSALQLAIKANYKKGIADSYNNIGNIYDDKGDYDKAIDFYFKSLRIREEIGDKNGMAASYNNIGIIHKEKGDYDKAIDFYFKSLKIDEEIGNKNGMAASYNNIGNIHADKGDYDIAIDFYFKSLKINEELGKKNGMANSYNNIGIIHKDKGDYNKAIEFYFKSLKIRKELGDKKGMALSYNNIGIIYKDKGDYNKAIEFYFKSLKIDEELGDKKGMALSYNNIGNLYLKQNKAKQAKNQQLLALNIATEIGAKVLMYSAYSSLAQCDSALGNFIGAYAYHKLYSQVHDSVFSKESDEKIADMGARYESEKKQLQIDNLNKENVLKKVELAQSEEKRSKQKIVIGFTVVGLLLILIFAAFIFRSLKITRKQKQTIEEQKHQVDEAYEELNQQNEEISSQRDEIEAQRDTVTEQKNQIEKIHHEVSQSIDYATRIQAAILPDPAILYQHISDHFVLFKPKDKVSGDFYWWAKIENHLIITVADCTGHGVPGAFMSMLGTSFLREIVIKEYMTNPAIILKRLRKEIIQALKQKGASGEQKDGMDMALVAINTETLEMQFAGANNPLWLIRKSNEQEISEIDEIKPDKQPVAIYDNMHPFRNNEIQLQSGDIIFLASDGYEDQFGGPKGKKFMSKKLKQLLTDNCIKSMSEQREILDNTIEDWKNNYENKHEQIDDITIMGIRII